MRLRRELSRARVRRTKVSRAFVVAVKRLTVGVLIVAVSAACSSSHHATLPGHVPDSIAALQFRRVLANVPGPCRRADPAKPLAAAATITLPAPNSDSRPCLSLGPALTQITSALRVDESRSPAGRLLVTVTFRAVDIMALDRVVSRLKSTDKSSALVAVVAIGQILSAPDLQELSQPDARAGRLQVAGGLDPGDSRPEQLAAALHAVLRTVGGA